MRRSIITPIPPKISLFLFNSIDFYFMILIFKYLKVNGGVDEKPLVLQAFQHET